MQLITPFLWFNDQAEEAAAFYCSIFPDSKILKLARYAEAGPGPTGAVMTVEFQLDGQHFVALNGGPIFSFTEAVSFVVNCQTQEEVDRYWEQLTAGGVEVQCGWIKDRFGLSWQIVPTALIELLSQSNAETANRVTRAMLQMKKLDIAALRQAAESS
ncbi:MAG: VOC family protein [Planctomycetota bacterium]|nr:MAG: VOC family protein [Planctomycetota bacterium]